MIRPLLMIAGAGFVLSVASLSAAVAIGGPEAMSRGGWTILSQDWGDLRWHPEDHHGGWERTAVMDPRRRAP